MSWTHHRERHRTECIGWLRAAVLGANDGLISTASLVVGVATLRLRAPSSSPVGGARRRCDVDGRRRV